MKSNNPYHIPTFGMYRWLINESKTTEIDEINNIALKLYFRTAILKYGFMPVLRKINGERIFVTLYHRNDMFNLSEIGHYLNYFYSYNFSNLLYNECNILKVPTEFDFDNDFVIKCQSMKDLENMIQSVISDDQYVSVNTEMMEGGETICISSSSCRHWDELLDERFLDPEYESNNRMEISIESIDGIKSVSKFLEETRAQYISSRVINQLYPGSLIVVAKDSKQGNINHTFAVLWRNIPLIINLKSYVEKGDKHLVNVFYNDKRYYWGFFTYSRGVKEFGDKPKIESGDYYLKIVVGKQSVSLIDCLKFDGALQETKTTDKVFHYFGHSDEKSKNSEGF